MPDILDRTAAKYPEMAALIFQGYSITYRQMKDMVDRFAACLADFGVKQGDAVAILLPNMIPQVIAYYATLRIGAITVLNNPLYSDPRAGAPVQRLRARRSSSRSTCWATA
ncbi:MAG: AMP-binding protein [Desulfobacterales bacterium]|nr:AMP-binding protein [Desulfobacterales bacterium]